MHLDQRDGQTIVAGMPAEPQQEGRYDCAYNQFLMNITFIDGSRSVFWAGLLLFGLALTATALLYQHVLDYPPCIVCIHVRIIVIALMLLALAALSFPEGRYSVLIYEILLLVAALVMLERSWQLLGTERGFIVGSCEFSLGLPEWLALESWLPALFEVQTSCGYTPELILGITMAEALLLISAALALAGAAGTCLALRRLMAQR